MKRFIALFLTAAALLSALSGCGRTIDNSGYVPTGDAIVLDGQNPEDIEPTEEDTQQLTLAYYPSRSLNPLFGSDYTNRVLMSLMYQGLFAVDSKKNASPVLVSGYRTASNNRTWIFYLDSRATFSDGSRVTPEDVVASYTRAQENDYYKNRFLYHVSEISVTDDGGIAFYLNTPFENLPMILDVPIVKAAEVQLGETAGETPPLGTGPYIFTTTKNGSLLVRNPNWWCEGAKVPATDETIDLVEVTSVGDVRDEFQFGKVSVVCTNPLSSTFAEYRCDYELWEIESGYMMYIGCNIGYSDFFEDGKLRTMLTYAIDRQGICDEVYRGMAYPATLPASPQEVFYNKTLAAQYEFNSLKFISSLSSYRTPTDKKGKDKVLQILVNSDDSARVSIARSIASSLTEMGLDAEAKEYSTGVFKNVLAASNYDIYLGMTRLSPNMDLSEFFRPYGELSRGGLTHENLLNMCANALENSGNYYNLYQKLAEDGRLVPILFGYYAVYAQRGLMPDLNPSRDNVFYYTLGKSLSDIKLEPVVEETTAE